jgi:hypothetical protein
MDTIAVSKILSMFSEGSKNDFERMAMFSDDQMIVTAKKMQDELTKFIESGDYRDYLSIKNSFENITRYMNSRDAFVTHNPDRGSRY